jgi:hypothetical protein
LLAWTPIPVPALGGLDWSVRFRGMRSLVPITAFVLAVTASPLAKGALPPIFIVQQQERAVRAYCAEWRKTQNIYTLDAEQLNQRVVTRLELQYPTVFPNCRPGQRVPCRAWIEAMVTGLRQYGERSIKSVCSSFQDEGAASQPGEPAALTRRQNGSGSSTSS